MSGLGSFDRAAALEHLATRDFDLLVVGGGITGAGVALDAAARGYRTALVEKHDFASGTSSKSSKLIHGGLRYLQQGEVGLVYQALAERQRLRHNAPHLVKVLPFLIPLLTEDGLISRKLSRALGSAMWMYDLTGGLRIGKLHKRIDRDEALAHMPTLRRDHLAGSYLYYDAEADDARLTLTVARSAAIDHGAVVVNRADVVDITTTDGRADGAVVRADGRDIAVRAACVVNAAGVWSDRIRALDEGSDPRSLRPAKGVHITVPWHLVRNDIAAVIPVPKDRRSVFVVPWGDLTYVGTTDTDYAGPLDDPPCTAEDIDYLLSALNGAIDGEITTADIVGTWAGLRPLVQDASSERTADLSRRHSVRASDSGVITVAGGKLTTYREMAADTVDAVHDALVERVRGRVKRRCPTKKLRLRGAAGHEEVRRRRGPLGPDQTAHLADRYGGEAEIVLAMIERDPALGELLVPGLPYLRAEAAYSARYEMVVTLDDLLTRRTRARLLARDASAAVAADVAALVADDLGWDAEEQERQVTAFQALVDEERAGNRLITDPVATTP
jgi:glycerol-3-phosphate dehydrogenase